MISAIYEVLAINHLHESQYALIALLLISLSLWAFLEVGLIRHRPQAMQRLGLLRTLLAAQIAVILLRHWKDFTPAASHAVHQTPLYQSLELSNAALSLPIHLLLFLGINRCLLNLFAAAERHRANQLQQQMAILRQVQADLEASEVRYRNFFNLPLIGTAILSASEQWIAVNETTCAILGYSREELFRIPWSSLTHPADLAAERQAFARMRRGELDGHQMEKRFIRKDGSVVHTLMASGCGPRQGEADAPFHLNIIDISDRKRMEAELASAQERELRLQEQQRSELEQKLKTSLTASAVAHEIQQPLATILLNCRLAEASLHQLPVNAIADDLRHQLSQLTANGDQVTATMERMRMLLRNVETQPSQLDLTNNIESALIYLQRDLQIQQVEVCRSGLEQPCPLLGDGAQLQSAMVNLIRNAIQAMACRDPGARRLGISLRRHGQHVALEVSDSGPGFPRDYNGATSWELLKSTKASGMGIGLFLAQTAAINHGGSLRVGRSDTLGGAQVVIEIPLRQPKVI